MRDAGRRGRRARLQDPHRGHRRRRARARRVGDGEPADPQGPRGRHGSVLAEDAGDPAVPRAPPRPCDGGREHRLAGTDGRDPQGVALHQLRLLRLGVQLDGVRPGLPRTGSAREGVPLRRGCARRRNDRAARALQRGARNLGLHPLLLLQRALPEGRRPSRCDREAGRGGDEGRNRPRHGREAREVVRHLGEDDRLAPRDGARAEDAGCREGDQGDQVRDVASAEGEGAATVPAARGSRRGRVARALRPREDPGPRWRRRHRPGGEGARAARALGPRGRRPQPPVRRPPLVPEALSPDDEEPAT